MTGEKICFESVTSSENLLELRRVTDAKNRVHIGPEAAEALRNGKNVYIVVGELVE